MMIYEFQIEYDNLRDTRQIEGLRALFTEIARDTEAYEDIIFDLADVAEELDVEANSELDAVKWLFEWLYENPESSYVDTVLGIAADLEAYDYFGSEGLDV